MQKFWLHQARRVAVAMNAARWLEFALPALAGWCFAAGCAVLMTRRLGFVGADAGSFKIAALFIVVALLAALAILLIAAWRVRRNWFSSRDALVHLEAALGLHNRLSSALAGVGVWPEKPAQPLPRTLRWRWSRLLWPTFCGVAFLVAAAWIPLSPDAAARMATPEPPLALAQVEAALEVLKNDEVAKPEALAALEEKLETLMGQPPETWYSQGSLEAADALRAETAQAASALRQQLNAAQQNLGELGREGSLNQLSAEQEAAWNETMANLQSGKLPLNPSALSQLQQARNKQLSPEQMEALKKQLAQNAATCTTAMAGLEDALNAALSEANGMFKNADDSDSEDKRKGGGGPGGGGDTAPLTLQSTPTDAAPQALQPLASDDTEHQVLGDIVKTTTGEHRPNPNAYTGPANGGEAASGAGGEATWNITTTPKEAAVLEKYFR